MVPLELVDSDKTVGYLSRLGFGRAKGTSLGLVPFSLYYKDEDAEERHLTGPHESNDTLAEDMGVVLRHPKKDKRKKTDWKTAESMATVHHVVEKVRQGSSFSFDYMLYTALASAMTANCLVGIQMIGLSAAMCIEPVMNTVTAMAFGTVVKSRSLIKLGLYMNTVMLVVCLLIGFLWGCLVLNITFYYDDTFPTSLVQVYGSTKNLWYGALQATMCGGVLGLSLLKTDAALPPMIGIAFAAALMVPVVNCGMLLAYVVRICVKGHFESYVLHAGTGTVDQLPDWTAKPGYKAMYYDDLRYECLVMSAVSMAYTYVNVVFIYLGCVAILKVKEVAPLGSYDRDIKFFHEDLHVFREEHGGEDHHNLEHESEDTLDQDSSSIVDNEDQKSVNNFTITMEGDAVTTKL
ncbi:hypothetical protein HDE_02195 [Halotydeus destructor]|nr:hypothetical protein HDE_02195 [Halotydeus destructor]